MKQLLSHICPSISFLNHAYGCRFITLDRSIFQYNGDLIGSAVARIHSQIPAPQGQTSIYIYVQDKNGTEQMNSTTVLKWLSPYEDWNMAGNITCASALHLVTFAGCDFNWDVNMGLIYANLTYSTFFVARKVDDAELYFIDGRGEYFIKSGKSWYETSPHARYYCSPG
jgi:hypothetical protein